MMGTGDSIIDSVAEVDYGLIPRTCEGLFERIKDSKVKGVAFEVKVSYIEIYNERVRLRFINAYFM